MSQLVQIDVLVGRYAVGDPAVREALARSDATVLYLGEDEGVRLGLAGQLRPGGRLIDLGSMLQDVAGDLREPFQDWIDGLNRKYGDVPGWFHGTVSLRDPRSGSLFRQICALEVFRRVWANAATRPNVLVLEHPEMAACILRLFSQEAPEFRIRRAVHPWVATLTQLGRRWWGWLGSTFRMLLRWGMGFVTRLWFGPVRIPAGAVWISTYLRPSDLRGNRFLENQGLARLSDWFAQGGKPVVVFPVMENFGARVREVFFWLRRAPLPMVIPEDFLHWSDVRRAFRQGVHLLGLTFAVTSFRGWDLTPLVAAEHDGQAIGPVLAGLLRESFCRRLARAGHRPDHGLLLYGYSPRDRGFCRGFRSNWPDRPCLGVRLDPPVPNMVCQIPLASEQAAGLLPTAFLETGRSLGRDLVRRLKGVEVRPVASLRYQYLFALPGPAHGSRTCGSALVMLVYLPADAAEAIGVLEMLRPCLGGFPAAVTVQVLAHPALAASWLHQVQHGASWHPRLEVSTDSFKDALTSSDIVLSTGSSWLVEALGRGIPVIFLRRRLTLDLDPFAGFSSPFLEYAANPPELERAVTALARRRQDRWADLQALSRTVTAHFFLKASVDTMQPLG